MLEEIKNIKTSNNDLKKFGILIGIILITIGCFLLFKEHILTQNFIIIGSLFLIVGFLLPLILKPIYLIWMTFAVILGWFMTRVILSFLFYILMTPIGLIGRIVGKDFIDTKNNKEKSSYWNLRNREFEKNQDYEKQF